MNQNHATGFRLGNEGNARAAMENVVNFASGYPGTSSSEMIQESAMQV